MSTTSTHRGLPDGMSRYDLARLAQDTRRIMQMSKTAANVLVHYITCCTFDQDYEQGRICAAWPRVSTVAERLDLCDRSVNGAERELVALGFLERTTGRNGARHGERSTDKQQKIKWAAGVNLAPLIARIPELTTAQAWMRREQEALKSLKAEIKHLARRIRDGPVAV